MLFVLCLHFVVAGVRSNGFLGLGEKGKRVTCNGFLGLGEKGTGVTCNGFSGLGEKKKMSHETAVYIDLHCFVF